MVKISSLSNGLKPKTICSIDASTTSMAFAIYEDEKLMKYGKIKFVGVTPYDRVIDAGAKARAFFLTFDKIDAIVIEHTVFMNSPKTVADLALVQGAMLGAAGIQKIMSVAPITWQNFIGNKKFTKEEQFKFKSENPGRSDSWLKTQERNLRKQRTIKFVDINYDRVVDDNDVADAIAIGHYAVNNWDRLTK